MTALMVPFCSFSTVVSLDASAQTEQEGAVEQLSVEKNDPLSNGDRSTLSKYELPFELGK